MSEEAAWRRRFRATQITLPEWARDAPDFSQRMVLTIPDGGRRMEAKGEMSRNGGAWEPDLQLTYSRVS